MKGRTSANNAVVFYTVREEHALLWRQDLTILPLSAFIYFLCYLDRSNIGNVRILNASSGHDMQSVIGATPYRETYCLPLSTRSC